MGSLCLSPLASLVVNDHGACAEKRTCGKRGVILSHGYGPQPGFIGCAIEVDIIAGSHERGAGTSAVQPYAQAPFTGQQKTAAKTRQRPSNRQFEGITVQASTGEAILNLFLIIHSVYQTSNQIITKLHVYGVVTVNNALRPIDQGAVDDDSGGISFSGLRLSAGKSSKAPAIIRYARDVIECWRVISAFLW